MKVLILTVSTGEGHNSTATAIHSELKNRGAECCTLDVCYYVNRFLGHGISYGYLLSIDSLSGGYSTVYKLLERRKASKGNFSPTKIAFGIFANRLLRFITNYDPDVIICTHIFAGISIEILKEKQLIDAKTYGIVTDYTVHPYWEELKCFDHIVLPSARLEWQCLRKGLKSEQILPLGIPIRDGFEKKTDKKTAKKILGMMPNKPLVMVMGGSMGYGNLSKIVSQIDKVRNCFQIIVVCGTNEEAYKKLINRKFMHNTKILGYTKDIPLIMDAADCIVTKPGGITVSEALAKELPLLLTTPIPGHEERNRDFLVNCGAAMSVSAKTSLDELVWHFFSDKECQHIMKSAAASMGKLNASQDLADHITISVEKE